MPVFILSVVPQLQVIIDSQEGVESFSTAIWLL